MPRPQPFRRRHRTSTDTTHRLGIAVSAILAIAGVMGVGIGVYAWTLERVPVQEVTAGVPLALSASPLFDPGATIFVAGDADDPPPAASWGCSLEQDGHVRDLTVNPDTNATGRRVHDSQPHQAVVTIGKTHDGDVLSCAGENLVVMPSEVGVRPIPLALVVGGVGLMGLAGLIHPRARGVRRFGT